MSRRTYDPNHPSFSTALAELRPALDAIPHEQLETIRLDVVAAIITALGLSPRLMRFRDEIAAELGPRAAEPIDRLEKAAQACGRAHAQHLTTMHRSDVAEMVAELSQTRRVLLREAEGLVGQKRLPRSALAELAGGTGYKELCFDVLQLVAALRTEWTAVESHTPVTPLELDRAEALANQVATTLGENEQPGATTETAELRQRAYTYFVRTYDEVRRAVAYIRSEEDDADKLAPSLYAGRARQRDDDEGMEPVLPNVPILPIVTPTNGSPSNGAGPVAAGPLAAGPVAAGPIAAGPVSPDMPGAPPFVQS